MKLELIKDHKNKDKRASIPHRVAWKGYLLVDDLIHRGITKTSKAIEKEAKMRELEARITHVAEIAAILKELDKTDTHYEMETSIEDTIARTQHGELELGTINLSKPDGKTTYIATGTFFLCLGGLVSTFSIPAAILCIAVGIALCQVPVGVLSYRWQQRAEIRSVLESNDNAYPAILELARKISEEMVRKGEALNITLALLPRNTPELEDKLKR